MRYSKMIGMAVQYDLHSHSTASDGTLAPSELVHEAHRQGVQVLALTDHDTIDGLAEARQAAAQVGLTLVPGVEVSVTWERRTVHVVGLNVDPEAPGLRAGLARLRDFRDWRAEEIGRRLAKAGVPEAFAGASRYAGGSIIGRTHFAHYLVEIGRAGSVRDVFKRFLVNDKPGYVPGQWASLSEAVTWIRDAGGQAVIAHPARYRLTATKLRKLMSEFMEYGGEGMEVVTGSHSRDECMAMAGHVRRQGLLASCGSDYHGPENPWIELGKLPALPTDCRPIWDSPNWPHAAVAAAAR